MIKRANGKAIANIKHAKLTVNARSHLWASAFADKSAAFPNFNARHFSHSFFDQTQRTMRTETSLARTHVRTGRWPAGEPASAN